MRWRFNYWMHRIKLFFNPPKPLLTVEEHKEWLAKSRRIEAQMDAVTKALKCKPDEMLDRVRKIQENIDRLNAQIALYNQPKDDKPPESI